MGTEENKKEKACQACNSTSAWEDPHQFHVLWIVCGIGAVFAVIGIAKGMSWGPWSDTLSPTWYSSTALAFGIGMGVLSLGVGVMALRDGRAVIAEWTVNGTIHRHLVSRGDPQLVWAELALTCSLPSKVAEEIKAVWVRPIGTKGVNTWHHLWVPNQKLHPSVKGEVELFDIMSPWGARVLDGMIALQQGGLRVVVRSSNWNEAVEVMGRFPHGIHYWHDVVPGARSARERAVGAFITIALRARATTGAMSSPHSRAAREAAETALHEWAKEDPACKQQILTHIKGVRVINGTDGGEDVPKAKAEFMKSVFPDG